MNEPVSPVDPSMTLALDDDGDVDDPVDRGRRAPLGSDADAGVDASTPQHAWVVSIEQHGMRIDRALADEVGAFSRSHLQSLIERGKLMLDGVVCVLPSKKVKAGQQVEVILEATASSRAFSAEPMPLALVHEDEHLIVIDKPVGLVVHPAPGHWEGTLLNGLLAHHAGAFDLPRAGIVQRLDKDTSGLMVVAKTLQAMTALVRDLAARDVRRQYLAIAHGHPRDGRFEVDQPIGRDPAMRLRMAVRHDAKPARTDFVVLHRDGVDQSHRACALQCTLHTGRTHQIRVHAASVGLPLVGDTLYGGRPLLGLTRQGLHAWHLGLTHPASSKRMTFTAPPPADFSGAWQAMGASMPSP